jgi:hypothetical protein
MQIAYAITMGFVASFLIVLVNRYEPNKRLARALTGLLFVLGALAIAARLGGDADTDAIREGASESNPAGASNPTPNPMTSP